MNNTFKLYRTFGRFQPFYSVPTLNFRGKRVIGFNLVHNDSFPDHQMEFMSKFLYYDRLKKISHDVNGWEFNFNDWQFTAVVMFCYHFSPYFFQKSYMYRAARKQDWKFISDNFLQFAFSKLGKYEKPVFSHSMYMDRCFEQCVFNNYPFSLHPDLAPSFNKTFLESYKTSSLLKNL